MVVRVLYGKSRKNMIVRILVDPQCKHHNYTVNTFPLNI